MFQSLGIELILHLRQLCAFRAGQLSLRAILCTGVILHAEEIIIPDIGQIVPEFLIPGCIGKAFSSRERLQIMKGECQADFDLRIESFDCPKP